MSDTNPAVPGLRIYRPNEMVPARTIRHSSTGYAVLFCDNQEDAEKALALLEGPDWTAILGQMTATPAAYQEVLDRAVQLVGVWPPRLHR